LGAGEELRELGRLSRLGFAPRGQFALDLIDEVEVEVEEPAHEVDYEEQVLLAMGELRNGPFAVVESPLDVCDVGAKRGHALAGDVLADEVADQQSLEVVALQ